MWKEHAIFPSSLIKSIFTQPFPYIISSIKKNHVSRLKIDSDIMSYLSRTIITSPSLTFNFPASSNRVCAVTSGRAICWTDSNNNVTIRGRNKCQHKRIRFHNDSCSTRVGWVNLFNLLIGQRLETTFLTLLQVNALLSVTFILQYFQKILSDHLMILSNRNEWIFTLWHSWAQLAIFCHKQ